MTKNILAMSVTDNISPKSILQEYFGYSQFRQHQEEIINCLLSGHDAFVLMPTGGGKSLCYQIPSLLRQGVGIVISPLIALMQDQVDALKQYGIRADFINSTLTFEKMLEVGERMIKGQIDLLYVAPERLLRTSFQRLLHESKIALFAIDEAHCISQWGHDFRPEYLQLSLIFDQFADTPKIALTATADELTRKEIVEKLKLTSAQQFISSFNRPNIHYRVGLKESAKQQLKEFLQTEHPGHSGIVYCQSRKKVEETAQWLSDNGLNALPYHAGLDNQTRLTCQRRFLREENMIIVATVAFGMGIDKPDVRFVVHLDMPKSMETYYQETGRAGRDGLPSDAWMIYSFSDIAFLRGLLDKSEGSEQFKRIQQRRIEAMLAYCETIRCRRQVLLNYFSEDLPEPCGNCDTCQGKVETYDGSLIAKKALSCIYRTGQRFGADYLSDVLMGKKTKRILNFKHDQVSTFGIGAELTKKEWKSVFRQLVASGFIQVDMECKGGFKLTPQSRPIFKGTHKVMLRKDPAPIKRSSDTTTTPKDTVNPEEASRYPFSKILWESLRTLRREIADENEVAPFIIFHDTTLKELVLSRPASLAEMKNIYGIGAKKLEFYGEQFLEKIHQHMQEHPDEKPYENSQSFNQKKTCSLTVFETLEYVKAQKTPQEIAQIRKLTTKTIYSHLAQAIECGELEVDEVVPLELDEIETIRKALLELSDGNKMYLKPVFEKFQGKYDYVFLECIRGSIRAEQSSEYLSKDNEKTKTYQLVCLANSRKYGGYCFAGKELTDSRAWFRVVSERQNGELAASDFLLQDEKIPELLDIVAVPLKSKVSHDFHKEDFSFYKNKPWIKKGRLPFSEVAGLCDSVDSIWTCSYHSQFGYNDRFPGEAAENGLLSSLLLIRPEQLSLKVQSERKGRKIVRAQFTFKDREYLLPVTDPKVEKIYLTKDFGIYPKNQDEFYLCLSVSELFHGYCYKLVAGIIGFSG
jgi:ATP-dependent DNA helicase RecQ